MKKLLALFLAGLMLVGCSSTPEETTTTTESAAPEASATTEVTKLDGLELQFVPSKDADVIIAGTEGLPELLSAATS